MTLSITEALIEAIDARTVWLNYGDGTAKHPTCNVDRMDDALVVFEKALIAHIDQRIDEKVGESVADFEDPDDELTPAGSWAPTINPR